MDILQELEDRRVDARLGGGEKRIACPKRTARKSAKSWIWRCKTARR